MKIIFETEKDWTKRVKCTKCNCSIELDVHDLDYISNRCDGASYQWQCPKCKYYTFLNATKIPANIRCIIRGL
jgi:hypothetical protein